MSSSDITDVDKQIPPSDRHLLIVTLLDELVEVTNNVDMTRGHDKVASERVTQLTEKIRGLL